MIDEKVLPVEEEVLKYIANRQDVYASDYEGINGIFQCYEATIGFRYLSLHESQSERSDLPGFFIR